MAKKKLNHQSKDTKQQNPSQESHETAKDATFTTKSSNNNNPLSCQSSMEDPSDKLQSLKSLNSFLVKDAFEKRQQIESLVQAKEALEAELSVRGSDEIEKNVGFELQNLLVSVYMVNQMREMGNERETEIEVFESKLKQLLGLLKVGEEKFCLVCKERDSARNDFELQVNEANLMKEKLMEMEKRERKFVEEIGKLTLECERLVGEEELEKMMKEKDFLMKKMKDMENEVENLKREIEEAVRDKKEIAMEKKEQRLKIDEMEKEMEKLGEVILSLRKEEGILQWKVFDLEKNVGEALDREAERAIEIGALVEEKRAKERSIENLMEEKGIISRSLEMTMAESEDRQRRIEKLLGESDAARKMLEVNEKELKEMQKKIEELVVDKIEIEKIKIRCENENAELQKEVNELKDVSNRLQKAYMDHEKKNEALISEFSRFREPFDVVTLERDKALKGLNEEKQNGVKLRSKISEMEKMVEKTGEELAKKRTELQNLNKEKKEMENQLGSMTDEKDKLQKELFETKRNANDFRAKMESASINYERAMTLLKNTASLLCQSKESAAIAEQKKLGDEDIEPYAAELEAIKQAFKAKETVAQCLKQKVEFMEKSMVEVQKKKFFWTLFSSATTLLAAVSIAYAAKGH